MKQKRNTSKSDMEQKKQPITRKPANLTPEEAAIFQRVKSAADRGREWETLTERDVDDFALREDPMKLPEFAQKLYEAKQYVFRWVTRSKERLDEINNMKPPFKWWIVNASTIPESEEALDPVLGCVSRLDQLLVFQPYWMSEARRQIREGLAESKRQAGDIAAKDGYIPADNIQMRSGPQFKIQGSDEEGTDVVVGEEGVTFMEGESEAEGLEELITEE